MILLFLHFTMQSDDDNDGNDQSSYYESSGDDDDLIIQKREFSDLRNFSGRLFYALKPLT